MNQTFAKKKLTMAVAAALGMSGALVMMDVVADNEFAANAPTISSNVSLTRMNTVAIGNTYGTAAVGSTVTTASIGTASGAAGSAEFTASTGDTITFSSGGLGTDPSAFVVGSTLRIEAPAGMMFVAEDGRAAASTIFDLLVANAAGSGVTTTASTAINTQFTDTSGALQNAITGYTMPISVTSSGLDSVVVRFNRNVGGGTGGQATDLTLVPIPAMAATPLNANLKMKAYMNYGASTQISADVGSVNVLAIPKLAKAELVGSDGLNLYFDKDIDLTTVSQGTGILLTAGGGGSDFVSSLGGTGDVSVDATVKNLVKIRNMSVSPVAGSTTIDVDTANDWVANALGSMPSAANSGQSKSVTVQAAGLAVSKVAADKTVVGANGAGGATYSATKKSDNSNKIVATFTASAGSPFKFRLKSAASGSNLTGESGTGCFVEQYDGVAVTGVTYANGVYTVGGTKNASGTTQMNIVLGNLTSVTGMSTGTTTTLTIEASTDEFVTKTTQDITVDRTAPSVVITGSAAAVATNRTTVTFAFDKEMDRTSVERLFVDNGSGATANDGVKGGTEESIYSVVDTAGPTAYAVKGVTLAADNKTVTLTTDLLPLSKTLKVYVNGAVPGGAETAAYRQGPMDKAGNLIETSAATYSLSAGTSMAASNTFVSPGEGLTAATLTNETTRRDFVKDGGTLRVEVTGPGNLGSIYVRAVDADKTSVNLGSATSFTASEVSTGLYRSTAVTLTTGMTASKVLVQASTDSTFQTGILASNSVVVDNTAPKVSGATFADANTVKVTFSEPVLVSGAQTAANYSIPGLQVSKAELDLTTEKDVKLTTTAMETGKTYTVDVAASVTDLAANAVNSSADTVGTDRATFTGSGTVSPTTTYTGTATGGVTSQTVDVSVKPASADVGQSVSVFVVAVVPNYGVYSQDATGGWTLWDGSAPFKAVKTAQTVDASTTFTQNVVKTTDLSGLIGTQVYAGYGVESFGSVASAYNSLLGARTYKLVYTVIK